MVRFGIVGAGAIAKAYSEALEQAEGVCLTAVADTMFDAAKSMADGHGAAAFASHRELALSGLCDAVIVSTPPATHEAVVLDLIEAGLPVLCEKPFAINGVSARRMASTAGEKGILISMASKFRYVDDVQIAREMVAAGEIGELKLIENVFTGVVDMTGRWNAQPEISGGGVLVDNGTHCVDIVRFFTGGIAAASAMVGPSLQDISVEDHVFMSLRTANGALAQIETSWSIHKDSSDYLALYGDEGVIEVGWKSSRIRRPLTGQWETFGTGYGKVQAFSNQVLDFAAGVRGEPTKSLATGRDILASVDVISAGYTSIAEGGRWVDVDGVATIDRVMPKSVVS